MLEACGVALFVLAVEPPFSGPIHLGFRLGYLPSHREDLFIDTEYTDTLKLLGNIGLVGERKEGPIWRECQYVPETGSSWDAGILT